MANIAFSSVGKLIELLSTATAGEDASVRIVSATRLALGTDPFHPVCLIDIGREVLVPCNQVEPPMNLQKNNTTPTVFHHSRISQQQRRLNSKNS